MSLSYCALLPCNVRSDLSLMPNPSKSSRLYPKGPPTPTHCTPTNAHTTKESEREKDPNYLINSIAPSIGVLKNKYHWGRKKRVRDRFRSKADVTLRGGGAEPV